MMPTSTFTAAICKLGATGRASFVPARQIAVVRELQKLTLPTRNLTSPGLTALLEATAAHAQKARAIIHPFRTESKK